MATEVGVAYVSILPSTQGFGRRLENAVQPAASQSGAAAGRTFGQKFGVAGAVGLGGIVAGISGAISKASEFDKTIRTVGAASGASSAELRQLTAVALDMGAKTAFSAQGAADAMLSLSKGGLTTAQIKAGALRDTLLLASAGGLDLGAAANFMVQGLTTFGLSADQGQQVAAALAGAANASTASVESIGLALSQVGPGAKLAGLSIQETTAALAAFDNAGIKGSDAGTSLKTMLSRLVPSTNDAANKMRQLGLDFTDAEGNIQPLRGVAEQLRQKLGGLSAEAKTTALNTIFGSDAFRAAAVLAEQGATGVDKYVKATSDANAAANLAKVGTSGYAGALDQFKGAVETAQIQLGTVFLPVATRVLNFLSQRVVPAVTAAASAFKRGFSGGEATGFFGRLGTGIKTAVTNVKSAFAGTNTESGALGATFRALGTAFQFVAQHAGTIATYAIPLLVAGFVALKIAQAAALAVAVASLPIRIAEVGANLALAASNRALAIQLAILNGVQYRGIFASIAHRIAVIAQTAATTLATVALRAYIVTMHFGIGALARLRIAFLAVNAAMRANPILAVIAALALLGTGLVVAYKRSETFRNIVDRAFATVKTGALTLASVAVKAFRGILSVWLTVAGGILGAASKLASVIPGMGGKFAAASAGFKQFKSDALASLDAVEAKAKNAALATARAQAASGARASTRAGLGVAARARAADTAPVQAAGGTTYNLNGNIVANDPGQMARQLEQRRRLAALGAAAVP